MTSSTLALAPGSEIGGYRVEAFLARGGMGVVYRARQRRPDRIVALKVISPELSADAGFRQRFEREADLAAAIEHENVIPIYEAGEDDGVLFLTMRFIEGTDLRELLAGEGSLEPRRATRILGQVAAALDAAHAIGLVHRDVKPANILIANRAGREHTYLTDFGLTKRVIGRGDSVPVSQETLTRVGTWVGTPDYVAPEQLEGKADARSDVYSLGCVVFQMLSGQVPFDRDSDVQKMIAHATQPPPLLSEVSPDAPRTLDAVVAKAMAKDPRQRYASAGELAQATDQALDAATPPAVPEEAPASEETDLAKPVLTAPSPTPPPPVVASQTPATAPLPPFSESVPPAPPPPLPPFSESVPPAPPAPPRRRRRLAFLLAGAGLVLAAIAAAAILLLGQSGSKLATAGPGTQNFSGSTDQNHPFSFQLSGDVVGGLSFPLDATCTDSSGNTKSVTIQFTGLPETQGTIGSDGAVDITVQHPEQTFRLNGRFNGDRSQASGVLSETFNADANGNLTLGNATYQCASNQVSWTASRG